MQNIVRHSKCTLTRISSFLVKASRPASTATDNNVNESTKKNGYVPRRAVLYVPGNDEKKIRKVASLDVDCAVLDCEDGVAVNRKEEARYKIREMLDKTDFGKTECVVRINAVSSGLMEEDLRVILQAKTMPSTLMIPKVNRPEEIDQFTKRFKAAVSGRKDSVRPYLITFVESAIGLMNLKNIFSKAYELQLKEKLYTLDGVVFGSDDYCADIGATRTDDSMSLLYARQKIITCAKAYRLQAIDMVDINYKDLDGLKKQSMEGAQMGFTGKQVIHPNQIPVVQEAFSPTQEQVEWATKLIQAFEQHQKSGHGAFTFQDRMIDMPLLLQAKNIVQMSENIK